MDRDVNSTTATHSLAALDIGQLEERAYRVLLSLSPGTVQDVAEKLSIPVERAQKLLDRIESKALASRSLELPPRYIAAPPELAVEALIRGKQALLEQARLSIADLLTLTSLAPSESGQHRLVEVISGREALGLIMQQLLQTVQTEVLGFQRAPVFFSNLNLNPPGNIRIRSVSDRSYVEIPGRLDVIRQVIGLGEEARFFDPLPLKMVVVDRRVAVIPLSVENPGGPSLLIRESSLVDALCALFDMTWARSTPLAFTMSGEFSGSLQGRRRSKSTKDVTSLLASGMPDKAIANSLGLSKTTFNRRIADLMRSLEARSRFQLGWRAALNTTSEPNE